MSDAAVTDGAPRALKPRALITGASRGIGLAIARALGSTHRILVGGTGPRSVDPVVEALPDAEPWPVDLADPAAIERGAADVLGGGPLDVLVHAAGIAPQRSIADFDLDEWRRTLQIDLVAPAQLTSLLLPALRAAHGIVVFINSGSGLFSYPNGSPYTEAKHALRTLADDLREEERVHGVRVTSVHPGTTDTEMGRAIRPGVDPARLVPPEAIAAGVRVAVDAPAAAQFEMLSIRPSQRLA